MNATATVMNAATGVPNATAAVMNTATGVPNLTVTVMNTATGVPNATATVMSTIATVTNTSVMGVVCASPPYLENGRTTEIRTYKYNSTAEFQCNSGFYLKGDATITCLGNNTWSYPRPTCLQNFFGISNQNDIHVQVGDTLATYPWLTIFLAVAAGLFGLLLLSCILFCCMRMCGYFRGTEIRVFPRGRLHLDEEVERGKRCNRSRTKNQHSDSKSGHRNINHSMTHTGKETSESSTPTYKMNASTMKERNNVRKNAKVSNTWMPHSHPIRNINTSTK